MISQKRFLYPQLDICIAICQTEVASMWKVCLARKLPLSWISFFVINIKVNNRFLFQRVFVELYSL